MDKPVVGASYPCRRATDEKTDRALYILGEGPLTATVVGIESRVRQKKTLYGAPGEPYFHVKWGLSDGTRATGTWGVPRLYPADQDYKGIPLLAYESPPPVGTTRRYWKGETITVAGVERTGRFFGKGDGAWRILWRREDGSLATSGLRSNVIAPVDSGLKRRDGPVTAPLFDWRAYPEAAMRALIGSAVFRVTRPSIRCPGKQYAKWTHVVLEDLHIFPPRDNGETHVILKWRACAAGGSRLPDAPYCITSLQPVKLRWREPEGPHDDPSWSSATAGIRGVVVLGDRTLNRPLSAANGWVDPTPTFTLV